MSLRLKALIVACNASLLMWVGIYTGAQALASATFPPAEATQITASMR